MSAPGDGLAVAILADDRPEAGLGHVRRMDALAMAMVSAGARVVRVGLTGLGESILDCPAPLLDLTARERCDLLVVDVYGARPDFFVKLRERLPTLPVVVLDDDGVRGGYAVHGIINPSLAAQARDYPPDLPFLALGPAYCCLSEAILSIQRPAQRGTRALLTMGGADPDRQTERVLDLLARHGLLAELDVILGPGYPDPEQARTMARNLPGVRVLQNPDDLPTLLSRASLAVTAGGLTCAELLYLGTPVALLALSPEQELMGRAVDLAEAGFYLGRHDMIDDRTLLKGLAQAVNSRQKDDMARRGAVLVDGQGATRLASRLLEFARSHHTDRWSPEEVQAVYRQASQAPHDHEKALWGSEAGMRNRFRLMARVAILPEPTAWLDVGCGVGGALAEAEEAGFTGSYLGVEMCPELVEQARSRTFRTPDVSFLCADFLHPLPRGPFDLVTCIGVLQKCGAPLDKSVARLAELAVPGGRIFVTTKNLDWVRFAEPGFIPCPEHHWFRLEEIRGAFRRAGLNIVRFEGFEPRQENCISAPEDSHSVYILAVKPAQRTHS